MENNLYNRYEKIRDVLGYTDYKVSKMANLNGTATLSNWKNGKYTPKDDKIKKIADALGVSRNYLVGETHTIICPVCGISYDLLVDSDCSLHNVYHEKYLTAKTKYPFLMNMQEANDIRKESIYEYTSYVATIDQKLKSFEKYLYAEFSIQLCRMGFNDESLNYDEFCKYEVGSLRENDKITEDFLESIKEKYGIKEYYFDFPTAQMAQEIKNNRELRTLFDAARDSAPEDILTAHQMLLALKRKEKGE